MRVLANAVDFFLCLIEFLIFARCIMSWIVMLGGKNSFSGLLYELTEFFLLPIRNLLNKIGLKNCFIDLSPMIAFSLIELLKFFFAALFF